ncbi:MAG: hypothetical protein WBM43_14310 [Flavobacteriaceae bacterium]
MAQKEQNPFKELERNIREVPPQLRKKVMNDVAAAKLLMDLASLFGANYPSLISSLFKTQPKK